nr:TIGR02996 domain-containing protein [Deltaproteobacteria bacterium]
MDASFEAAILENPDDDAPYLVYADYLMAQG